MIRHIVTSIKGLKEEQEKNPDIEHEIALLKKSVLELTQAVLLEENPIEDADTSLDESEA